MKRITGCAVLIVCFHLPMACHSMTLFRTLLPHSVSRTLRSTGANLLHVPKSNIVKGDRAFMIAGPRVWNSLPSNIRTITNLLDFKKKLKTFLYRKAFM